MIRKYLERNGKIKFKKDFINKKEVVRIEYSGEFWMNEINFLEWMLIGILDKCSGFYGYRSTMVCTP